MTGLTNYLRRKKMFNSLKNTPADVSRALRETAKLAKILEQKKLKAEMLEVKLEQIKQDNREPKNEY
jgi:hypothetical protein